LYSPLIRNNQELKLRMRAENQVSVRLKIALALISLMHFKKPVQDNRGEEMKK